MEENEISIQQEDMIRNEKKENVETKKSLAVIDIVKFIASLIIVIIHTASYALADMAADGHIPTGSSGNPLVIFVLPLLNVIGRVCVPFFFVSSSYFLFKKMFEHPEDKSKIIKNYIKRLLQLYLFWIIASTFVIADKRFMKLDLPWYTELLLFFKDLIFSSGIGGSWYLVTSVYTSLIIYGLSKYVSNKWLLFIGVIMYVVACLSCTYYGIFRGTAIQSFLDRLAFLSPAYMSTFSGMIFMVFGKMFAEKKLQSKKIYLIGTCVLPFIMYGEYFTLNYFGFPIANDSFVSLALFSYCFFGFILNLNVKPKPIYKEMRKCSTFIYLSHFVELHTLYFFVNKYGWSMFKTNYLVIVLVYLGVLGLSIIFYHSCSELSKKKPLSFLKYAY